MNNTSYSPAKFALITSALLLSLGAAQAGAPSPANAEAQQRFRQEMAVCDSGQSPQGTKVCRTEARNALADAGRSSQTETRDQYSRNAVQRCSEFQGDDRKACEARVFNPSRIDGSVSGGGLVRESVIQVPVQ